MGVSTVGVMQRMIDTETVQQARAAVTHTCMPVIQYKFNENIIFHFQEMLLSI